MQRMIFGLLAALILTSVLERLLIPVLRRLKFGQTEREDGPQSHLSKTGTPTMGGLAMVVGIAVATLCFSGNATFAWVALLVTLAYGLVGFLDDFIKIRRKRSLGLRAYQKIIGQFGIALVIAIYAYNDPHIGSCIYFPFFDVEWDMGIFYIPFMMFLVIGTVNSVNLTDGLDGLASSVTMVYSIAMALIFLIMQAAAEQMGQVLYAANLESAGVFALALAGACIGFLRHNVFPAKVFMGDTGSLALGGAISMLAIYSRAAFLLILMGICFVASAVSVILQVGSYKLRGKRIFKMAPLHHHFELKGLKETQIVAMYTIITVVTCLVGLLAYV